MFEGWVVGGNSITRDDHQPALMTVRIRLAAVSSDMPDEQKSSHYFFRPD